MSGADVFDQNDDRFDDLIDLLRDGPIDLTDEAPSASVWDGIASELGLGGEGESSGIGRRDATPSVGGSVPTDAPAPTNVVSLAERRARWGKPVALVSLAAAVALLVGVPVGLALFGGSDTETVAIAELELLDGQTGTPVSAEILSVDGDLVIEVDAPTSVGDDEFLELWLLSVDGGDVADLESLGRLDGSDRYDVPDDIDLEQFSVVDISIELDDGDDDHSGNSVVRGELA